MQWLALSRCAAGDRESGGVVAEYLAFGGLAIAGLAVAVFLAIPSHDPRAA